MQIARRALIATIVIFLITTGNTLAQTSAYSKAKSLVGCSDKRDKYIACVYYTPLGCINCNAAVSAAFTCNKYKRIWDAYIIYPGIRAIEVNDYQKNLMNIGDIKLIAVNNQKVYSDILQISNVKIDRNSTFMILFSPYTHKGYKINLKEPNVFKMIDSVIALRMK